MKTSPFKRNTVWTGIAIGIGIPVLTYAVLLSLYTLLDKAGIISDVGFAEDFRTRTLGLVSICANLFVIRFRRKLYEHETVRGMLIATMILVGIWFWQFGFNILRG